MLPKLSRKNKRKESKIDGLVLDWFAKNYHRSVAIEVKLAGNKILSHQNAALKEVQSGTFSHKLPDDGRRQPYDGFVLKNADAFLVVCKGKSCSAFGYNGNKFHFFL